MPYAYTEPQNYVDESFFLALNTFYMSLKAYFDSTDKASPAIRENMQSFQSKYASAFHDLESLDDTFRAHMAQTGLALYNETLSPLARAWKCKDPAYVLKVVHSFTVYAQTTIPLWIARTQFKAPDKDMCFNVIDRHLLNILVKTSDPRRALVCLRLLFEAQAISQYLLLLEPLHATQRNDPKHPVVRGMFWAASYLYHSLDPLWDADRHAPCTQNLLAKAVPSEDLTCALRTQVYMSVERCLIRIFCKDKITFRLQSYLSSLKERNLLDSQKYALVHEHLALLQRFPHAGSLAFPPAQDLDLQCAIQVLASCVTPSLAMMTSRLQTATIFLELNAHEIQPAAPSSNPNKKKRRKSTLAKQRHAAQLCAIQGQCPFPPFAISSDRRSVSRCSRGPHRRGPSGLSRWCACNAPISF